MAHRPHAGPAGLFQPGASCRPGTGSPGARQRAKFVDRIRAASLADIRKDPELFNFALAGGRSAFPTNCLQCHGAGGAGSPGFPNLVDDDWIWGGSIDQIYATIEHGIRNTDDKSRQSLMPRFGVDGLLTGTQVGAVTDYVLSLSGTRKGDAGGRARSTQEQCVACHKADGKGNQELGAPNLTDGIWLYGGDRDAIYRTIFYARNGSMPAWGDAPRRCDDEDADGLRPRAGRRTLGARRG